MDPLAYLFSLEKLGIKFGLDNIRTICRALGEPQSAWPSVIIAGTNGKGSVAAMVEAGLRAAGHRTGLYTSPHLVRLEERFAIDGRPVATADLAAAARLLQQTIADLRANGSLDTEPTFFEVTTAIGFELFRRAGATFVVLEVGLGGRFDATNVATPVAAAITTIDFDHERFLGHTIAAIAAEKAGVVKPGMRVIVGERKADALETIDAVCRSQGATLIRAGENVVAAVRGLDADGHALVELSTPHHRYGSIRLALAGRHQVANAVVAARLLEELRELGTEVPSRAVHQALTAVRWPGRLELLQDPEGRRVLCDAAHNPEGARALAAFLAEVYPDGLPVVFGIMKDKDVVGTLQPLLQHATHLVLTRAHTDRALSTDALLDVARRVGRRDRLEVEPDPKAALERAWARAPLAVAAGSIFMVGELVDRLAPVTPPSANPRE